MQETLIATYRGLVAFVLMFISGSIALLIKWLTFGKSVNWGSKYIGR